MNPTGAVSCPLCEASAVVSSFSSPHHTLVSCTACGLVFDGHPPSGSISTYEDHGGRTLNPWLLADYRLLTRARTVRRVLDVGCGKGSLLRFLRSRGIAGAGIEPSPYARRLCRERFDGPVFADLEEAAADGGRYDAAVLLFSLEHLPDPVGALDTLYSMLEDGGVLVIRVPNIDSLESQLFGSRWFQVHLPAHCFHFNPHSVARLLDRTGFDVLDLDTEFTPQGAISAPCSMFPRLGSAFMSSARMGRGRQLMVRGALAGVSMAFLPLVYAECVLGKGPIITVLAQRRDRS